MFREWSAFSTLTPSLFYRGAEVRDEVVRGIFETVYPHLIEGGVPDYDVNRFCSAAFHYPTVLARLGRPLRELNALEIGGGKGMKSLAWAPLFKSYACVDLATEALVAGRALGAAAGIDNLEFVEANGVDVIENPSRYGFAERFDVLVLYAVIEHLTLDEREYVLGAAEALLNEGGLLLVAEAPNRLVPMDSHTTQLPFFQQLPDELALRYIDRSPRHAELLALNSGRTETERLYRMGRGVSFHEFDLFFPTLGSSGFEVLHDGYDAASLNIEPLTRQELDLEGYLARNCPAVPRAFTRYWIDFIARRGALPEARRRLAILPAWASGGASFVAMDADWSMPRHVLHGPAARLDYGAVAGGRVVVTFSAEHPGAVAEVRANGDLVAALDLDALRAARPPIWHGFLAVEIDVPEGGAVLSIASARPGVPLVVGPVIG